MVVIVRPVSGCLWKSMILVCEVWLRVIAICIIDSGFWLALPLDVGMKLAEPH